MEDYALEELRGDVVLGLLYVHHQLGANTGKALEASSFLYALTELLIERGVITEKELNERKIVVAKRLTEKFREIGMGAAFQEEEQDKYGIDDVQIDCEERKHLCKAACCKMSFALSRQDIKEGIVKWDLGHPYMIAKEEDGYCTHFEKTERGCGIWKNRPVPCRAYDCRNDKRIWIDFEKRIVNPELLEIFERKDAKKSEI
ncbi:MAG: YkgJ family cysteine cluster protein [Euryarchaeota archaeon]|nr:YkgJ family cysteine cluster protein [Euryarchaeota archaeon]